MPKNRGCEEACDKGKKVPLSKEEKETGEEVAKLKREIITENDVNLKPENA